ncbi:protein abrupt isoform X4 [Anthonomus grandis grandis]|uniref:protein abrupt isoform X4 n=1 Tax=Anthonomus grandis grandis TaxID=2921223 RepID=UPI00216692E0|nr:protein abrupt isoform X4 [Anthonomus grandis grandis]
MGAETTPSEQQYSLRWNDFHSSILSSFRHLRDEEDFVDVTLACDGCSFTAHKVVLSACSPYFRRLLKANPCQHPIVILRDVQHKDMESLLRFMYNGEVHVGQEHLTDFLKTAQMLQVRGLADVPAGAGQRLTTTATPTPTNPLATSEQKISPNSSSLPWATDRPEPRLRETGDSPPPAKRARSSDRLDSFTERLTPSSRTNNNPADISADSLLGQALEGGTNLSIKEKSSNNSESPNHLQSTCEDSNSSDLSDNGENGPVTPKTEPSDYPNIMDDHNNPFHTNGGVMDQNRPPSFPGALLGLQGLSGLPGLPGPSGVPGSMNDFDATGGDNSLHRHQSRTHQQRLQHHQQQQQHQTMTSSLQYEMKYECPLCDKVLKNLVATRAHLDQHYPRESLFCPVQACARRFAHPNSVRNHMRQKHSQQWTIMKQIKWTL